MRDYIKDNPGISAYQARTLTTDLLAWWNESISSDAETFWLAVRAAGVPTERKDPLRMALTKKRFRTVEQAIAARNNWTALKKLPAVTGRFSTREIEAIDHLIGADEADRLRILQECLRRRAIPPSQYLKAGECMAYFANCLLFQRHFTTAETAEL